MVFLIGAVVAARRVAKVPTVRLVSTKQPPELSVVTGLTWHLFLSHIWCVAQLGRVIKPGRIQLQPPLTMQVDRSRRRRKHQE